MTDPGPVFAALADPTRRRLLDLLAAHGSATATELARELPVTRQAIAKHLALLDAAGLVESGRFGREARFRLAPQPLTNAAAWMTETGARWEERLRGLEAHLADPR